METINKINPLIILHDPGPRSSLWPFLPTEVNFSSTYNFLVRGQRQTQDNLEA